jgi:dolichyl-phosphate-mannose--protein O-mannosyl transferase
MSDKIYHYSASILFGVLTVLHLARALQGWDAQVAGTMIPVWISWVAVVIAGYLMLRGFSLGHKHHQE